MLVGPFVIQSVAVGRMAWYRRFGTYAVSVVVILGVSAIHEALHLIALPDVFLSCF